MFAKDRFAFHSQCLAHLNFTVVAVTEAWRTILIDLTEVPI